MGKPINGRRVATKMKDGAKFQRNGRAEVLRKDRVCGAFNHLARA